jgi:hypothetical protein
VPKVPNIVLSPYERCHDYDHAVYQEPDDNPGGENDTGTSPHPGDHCSARKYGKETAIHSSSSGSRQRQNGGEQEESGDDALHDNGWPVADGRGWSRCQHEELQVHQDWHNAEEGKHEWKSTPRADSVGSHR